ncbi:MAG TPA: bacillithiol biosynthesis deacetylase BshB1 [Melioribacteraceae bacterium]|nr:bacillithiol biosynthesis deacetylase BshB1 [Melioribacteraceae bacterium]
MELDILILTAHPDDAEISIGGTIAKFTDNGYKVGIVDFTEGELGTRGTKATRRREAEDASKILKLSYRTNLKIPDGKVKFDNKYLNLVITEIRKTKPKIIFAPYFNDRHPDHIGAGILAKESYFFSGLPKIKTKLNGKEQEPFRPQKLFYFMMTYEFTPSFINDVTNYIDIKMDSILAYKTQFFDPNSNEPETFISKPGFLEAIKAKAKYYGFKINKDYGEPFFCEESLDYDFKSLLI